MVRSLSSSIRPGIVNRAGTTPESHRLLESLLEDDRKTHHCFFNKMGFHNHLSHHLLAAYDLGASAKLVQAINDDSGDSVSRQRPIDLDKPKATGPITEKNWTEHLEQEKYYSAYLDFFLEEISATSVSATLEKYVFSPGANGNGSEMFARFMGGTLHPFIQTGYAAEFGNDPMIALGLAMAAMTDPFIPALFDFDAAQTTQSTSSLSLFEIIRRVYDSETLQPVMPYDNHIPFNQRIKDATSGGRVEAIHELVAQWFSADEGISQLEHKHEELIWLATLLFAGSGRPGRKPRFDFFLMHILTSSLFIPSLLAIVPAPALKVKLLKAYLAVAIFILITRGRPRIDAELMMSYTATPAPPTSTTHNRKFPPSPSAVGDPNDKVTANPWDVIVPCVMHAPDSHIVKSIRALYFASQRFGHTAAGDVPGALDKDGKETHKGMSALDGSVFVRAAGVAMDGLGWVTYGEKAKWWDGSGSAGGHGWDEAWKEG
ncbi:hypothetical protein FIBSPDRAFT_1047623 [Athelia psychrophila]|uniref:Oxidoreductase AflY n=1 Tax=Athelia psychrophila TaxID=1759441 RepID=A0A166EYM7_9AGAM|nr:hypothetical protein FIBSPDRAFT_1047623 [Fibularhizoctonia sp. CBS 109695]